MRGSVVQKQHSGKWYVVLDLERDGSGQGRRQKWHSGYATKREAERALAALLTARDEGSYVEPCRLTLGAYLVERWLPAVATTAARRR